MPFHLMVNEEAANNTPNLELDAVPDGVFSIRNDHFIFAERWNLIAAEAGSPNMQRARFSIPMWNAFGRHHIQPVNGDADTPSNPQIADYRDYPLEFPRDEEIAMETTNTLASGTEDSTVAWWVAPPDWNRNIPRGIHRFLARATVAPFTTAADAWSATQPLIFDEQLRGGTYAVVGAQVFSLGPKYFRLQFIRAPLTQGRLLRPGGLVQQAPNEIPLPKNFPGGVWGLFHTFEQPTIDIYSGAAAVETPVVYLDLVYLGPDRMF